MWFGVFLVLIAVPLLELALLIKLGQAIGVFGTFAVLFLSAGIGLMVMQAQGWSAFNRASQAMRDGKAPVEPMMDSFMLMIAGGLMIAPGLLSDAAGLLLLIPPVRRLIAKWWFGRFEVTGVRVDTWSHSSDPADPSERRPRRSSGQAPVIDGEFERLDEHDRKPPSGSRDATPPTDPRKPKSP